MTQVLTSRRDFLKSIGIVATAIAIPVSVEIATKPFLAQESRQNYLVLQSNSEMVVGEVRAIDLDMAQRKNILRVVFEESFDIRKIVNFSSRPSRLSLDLFNGVPMKFEGAGVVSLVYRVQEGNCIEVRLDQFRCLTSPIREEKNVDFSGYFK